MCVLGGALLTVGSLGTVCLWRIVDVPGGGVVFDLADSRCASHGDDEAVARLLCCAASAASAAVVGTSGGAVQMWRVDGDRLVLAHTWSWATNERSPVLAIACTRSAVLTGHGDGSVRRLQVVDDGDGPQSLAAVSDGEAHVASGGVNALCAVESECDADLITVVVAADSGHAFAVTWSGTRGSLVSIPLQFPTALRAATFARGRVLLLEEGRAVHNCALPTHRGGPLVLLHSASHNVACARALTVLQDGSLSIAGQGVAHVSMST
jgi:hypothetical protein